MKKADLVTASAIASLLSAGYAAESLGVVPNSQTSNTSSSSAANDGNLSGELKDTGAAGGMWEPSPGAVIRENKVEYWTHDDKLHYKELVLKWSENPSDLSASEMLELDRLEARRARLEAPQSPDQIIAEFRTRMRFSNLLISLKDASR